jgi:hypothetical protein
MTAAKPETKEVPVDEATGEVIPTSIIPLIARIAKEAGALAPVKTGGVPFPFRGVDGTVNHLSPFLQKYGVVVAPKVLSHNVSARELDKGRALTQSEVVVQFTFYAPDGTSLEVVAAGLAQDYADRSTAQAQSVAFRIALLQTFTLPTMSPEPEQAGEDNAKYIAEGGAAAPKATRVDNSIAKAGAAADPLAAARTAAKAAAGAKGLSAADLNEMGKAIDPDFFNKVDALNKLVAKLGE